MRDKVADTVGDKLETKWEKTLETKRETKWETSRKNVHHAVAAPITTVT